MPFASRDPSPPRPRGRTLAKNRARLGLAAAAGAAALLLAGCGKQSILSSRSPQAHNITLLWWWMLGVAAIVFFGAVAMLAIGYFRRDTPGLPFLGKREDISQGMVLLFGIGIPLVVLVALFGVSDVYLVRQTSPPAPSSTKMTIEVIGHQWWWEVRYPGSAAVTANEIHIPVDTRVNVVTLTADVIHSFWVPQLNRKIDMVPGMRNRVLLYSDRTGTYRGQCSQYCGLQHAHMSMYVFVQTRANFNAWLANMARDAPAPLTAQQKQGEQLFVADQCASCHQIRGISDATVGPDLTHLASRTTLAALTIPNTPRWLAAWIRNPQKIKPGDRMPDLGLPPDQVNPLVTYLDSLH